MRSRVPALIYGCSLLAGLILPTAAIMWHRGSWSAVFWLVIVGNTLGWFFIAYSYRVRSSVQNKLNYLADVTRVKSSAYSLEGVTDSLVREMQRRDQAVALNLGMLPIRSREELSRALQRISSQVMRTVKAEAVELALYDKTSRLYHSALLIGVPAHASTQAMLWSAGEEEEEIPAVNVIVQPVEFAGTVLGTLRVELAKGIYPSRRDREVVKLFAIQGVIAILNAEYTGELMKLKNNSEESIKAKTGFLANLSHEVRGPLGLMLNAVELIEQGLCGDVNDEQRDMLQMARSNGSHLLDLMNDVLDYAKAECGKSTPEPEAISVNDLLKDMIGVVRAQAEAKGHRLRMVPSAEPLHIRCDRRHSRQILINLLTNAIKYTPDGGAIEMWAERAAQGRIRISVRDTGVGIAPQDRSKVFAAFERVNETYSRNQNGTGLGMPLTKSLVELNGGMIDFESRRGEGSHFWILFDSEVPQEQTVVAEQKDSFLVKGNGAKVLLVGRDSGELSVMKRYLQHHSFVVLETVVESEMAELAAAHHLSLVILDESFVATRTGAVLQLLRNVPRHAQLPVVVLSSDAFAVDIEKYLRAGVDRCLIKPVDLSELGRISMQLSHSDMQSNRTAEQREGPTTQSLTDKAPVLH